jgi:hypothetical protein
MDNEQGDLFDGEEAKRRRDEALKRVSDHNATWFTRCVEVATRLAKENPKVRFTGEDIRWHCLGMVGQPKHPNAWGALIHHLIKGGVIYATGEHRPMRAKLSHARSTPVYQPICQP